MRSKRSKTSVFHTSVETSGSPTDADKTACLSKLAEFLAKAKNMAKHEARKQDIVLFRRDDRVILIPRTNHPLALTDPSRSHRFEKCFTKPRTYSRLPFKPRQNETSDEFAASGLTSVYGPTWSSFVLSDGTTANVKDRVIITGSTLENLTYALNKLATDREYGYMDPQTERMTLTLVKRLFGYETNVFKPDYSVIDSKIAGYSSPSPGSAGGLFSAPEIFFQSGDVKVHVKRSPSKAASGDFVKSYMHHLFLYTTKIDDTKPVENLFKTNLIPYTASLKHETIFHEGTEEQFQKIKDKCRLFYVGHSLHHIMDTLIHPFSKKTHGQNFIGLTWKGGGAQAITFTLGLSGYKKQVVKIRVKNVYFELDLSGMDKSYTQALQAKFLAMEIGQIDFTILDPSAKFLLELAVQRAYDQICKPVDMMGSGMRYVKGDLASGEYKTSEKGCFANEFLFTSYVLSVVAQATSEFKRTGKKEFQQRARDLTHALLLRIPAYFNKAPGDAILKRQQALAYLKYSDDVIGKCPAFLYGDDIGKISMKGLISHVRAYSAFDIKVYQEFDFFFSHRTPEGKAMLGPQFLQMHFIKKDENGMRTVLPYRQAPRIIGKIHATNSKNPPRAIFYLKAYNAIYSAGANHAAGDKLRELAKFYRSKLRDGEIKALFGTKYLKDSIPFSLRGSLNLAPEMYFRIPSKVDVHEFYNASLTISEEYVTQLSKLGKGFNDVLVQ